MRWILGTLFITTLVFCLTRALIKVTDSHADLLWEWAPGRHSNDLSHLDDELRVKVIRIMTRLKEEHFNVTIVTTWRSPRRQKMLHAYGRIRHWAGLGPATALRAKQSCHTQLDSSGSPKALAVDLRLRDRATTERHVTFFRRLGALARKHNLRWGGDWQRSNPTWRRYNLGWDPGHLESLKCR